MRSSLPCIMTSFLFSKVLTKSPVWTGSGVFSSLLISQTDIMDQITLVWHFSSAQKSWIASSQTLPSRDIAKQKKKKSVTFMICNAEHYLTIVWLINDFISTIHHILQHFQSFWKYTSCKTQSAPQIQTFQTPSNHPWLSGFEPWSSLRAAPTNSWGCPPLFHPPSVHPIVAKLHKELVSALAKT